MLMPPWPRPHHKDTPASGEGAALQLEPARPEWDQSFSSIGIIFFVPFSIELSSYYEFARTPFLHRY